ncbi:IS110 family transposase [Dictyobacter formicarum]|uniref:IS110 family transposase n=1 Tax=Dictyobacter formicarum TaxID=2778368 RepID=UPI001F2E2B2B|nr:IS110 family transposase [Dictyobacter formicarum]
MPSSIIPKGSAQFERLAARIGKQKAIVAVARKLLVTIWHVLSQQEADCHAQVETVTRKLLNWISHTRTTPGKRRDRLLLLYNYLDQLGLSEEVEQVTYHGSTSSTLCAAEAASSDPTARMSRAVHLAASFPSR